MKSVRLLDSSVLVKYCLAEPGAQRLIDWFEEYKRGQEFLLVCELNLGEVYYAVGKRFGLPRADEVLGILEEFPLKRLPLSWELVLQAARLKAEYPLAYADCFAAACAMNHQAVLVTSDREFRAVEHLVKIDWM